MPFFFVAGCVLLDNSAIFSYLYENSDPLVSGEKTLTMKKCCVWLLALCVSQGVAAQDPEAGECVFHTGLEQYPTFMGGDLTEFRAWVYRNVRYPREAFDRGEQGRILVSFVIDTLGNVTQVGPLSAAARGDEECGKESPGTDERYKELLPERKAGPIGISESPALVREAVRVVRSSPRWAPARMGGGIANSAKVPVKYLLPIDFLLKPDTSHRWPAVVPPAEWSPEYIFCPEPQRHRPASVHGRLHKFRQKSAPVKYCLKYFYCLKDQYFQYLRYRIQ